MALDRSPTGGTMYLCLPGSPASSESQFMASAPIELMMNIVSGSFFLANAYALKTTCRFP